MLRFLLPLCLVLAAPTSGLFAASLAQQRLLADAADGACDEHTLLSAALVAGGTEDLEQIQRYETRVEELVRLVRPSLLAEIGSDDTALLNLKTLHQFLYQNVLLQYDANVTNLAALLDDGTYNCVTATALFVIVGERLGLPLAAVQMPGHVRCALQIGDRSCEFETASPVFAVAGPRAANRRTLRDHELVATFYFNRGHALHERGQFEAAVEAQAAALALDPHCLAAHDNLLAILNNWAVARAQAGDHAQAAKILDAASKFAPGYEPYQKIRAYLSACEDH